LINEGAREPEIEKEEPDSNSVFLLGITSGTT
jgi:hypothetical protein